MIVPAYISCLVDVARDIVSVKTPNGVLLLCSHMINGHGCLTSTSSGGPPFEILCVQEDQCVAVAIPGLPDHFFFAVFDGHGGAACAKAAASDKGILG